MNSSLLMAYQNVLNGVLFEESVIDMQNCATRVTPDVLDVLGLKRFDENFGASQLQFSMSCTGL